VDDKVRDLIQAVLENTAAGGLKWTGFGSNSFRTKIGSGHLHVTRGTEQLWDDAGSDGVLFLVQVTDALGRVVAEYGVPKGPKEFPLVSDLFDAARRSALGTDQVIDDMLTTLRGARAHR
jgi:hypothetical protein